MATNDEMNEAVRTARDIGCQDLVLLKCTSPYPAGPENSTILTIPHLRELFGCEVGLSDYTMGIGAAVAAVAHGATVIEKHFTFPVQTAGLTELSRWSRMRCKALLWRRSEHGSHYEELSMERVG